MLVHFSIEYQTVWGETLVLEIGEQKYPMQWNEGGIWTASVQVSADELKHYGYLVMQDGIIRRREWEPHSSRPARQITDHWLDCPVPDCPFPTRHQNACFDRPGFRGAGTAIPVFALRTADDFGIGEFHDLFPLVDWAEKTGQIIIQLLPVTDTTRKGKWKDSYPYSPVSSFALHPLYLHLPDIGVPRNADYRKTQAALNALPEIDYPRVFQAKMALVRQAFESRGKQDLASAAYRRFYRANAEWLGEYAEFCACRDANEPEYHAWMQFHLDRQFRQVVDYARAKGISFKGDLPIGISQDSADAWWHPELFNLDSSAGAPPDYFSEDGQNWGFPTYNWEEMAKDDYAWWKRRLRHMSRYFDALRIDHILGFFRIWEIPAGRHKGVEGHFNPALSYSAQDIAGMGLPLTDKLFVPDPHNAGCYQPHIRPDTRELPAWQQERFGALYNDFFFRRNNTFWQRNAERKLPELLGATNMLFCGEDLGMVPDCVPEVLERDRILTLEMSAMEKGRPWPRLSVCATSSHDMPTLRMQYADGHGGQDMPAEEVRHILRQHLESQSMLAIFPLQDWVALDPDVRRKDFRHERINEPADSHHHWRYRFHMDLNALGKADALNADIRALLAGSGRENR
ncbi:MAG: 4-alpha-glucanotransferase [Bacteroidales bacterium]|nr:4-alpha-glucanotransferase [Bacteroidales bacterium]